MRDILPELERWSQGGLPIALASVVSTWGSAPRPVGANMGIAISGEFCGSVSGGCVEAAVLEAGLEVLKTKIPRFLHFEVSDNTAWGVGLACGGSLDIFVNPLDPELFQRLKSILEQEQPAVFSTIILGPEALVGRSWIGTTDGQRLDDSGMDLKQVDDLVRETITQGTSRRGLLAGSIGAFFELIQPPPTLLIVGGVHIAMPLVSIAKTLGYKTILIDPRRAWGNAHRFSNVDEIIQAWPDEALAGIQITSSTAITVLTHDPKLDDPALKAALESPAFYVGALGGRVTQANRYNRLKAAGLTQEQLARLHAPIGLNLGGQTPEEIALAIMAEVVLARRKVTNSAIPMLTRSNEATI